MDIANALVDALFSQCRVGVGVCDGDGRLREFNPTLESMIGPALCHSAQQEWAPAYYLFDAAGRRPPDPEEIPLVRALAGETVTDAAITTRRPGHPVRHLRCTAAPLHDGERTSGALVLVTEVSEHEDDPAAMVDAQLTRYWQRISRLQELSSRVATIANHQIRTPLTVIQAHLELLEDAIDELPEDTRRAVPAIRRGVTSLTDALTALARANDLANAADPALEAVDLVDVARRATILVRASHPMLRIHLNAGPTSYVPANADSLWVRRAIAALIEALVGPHLDSDVALDILDEGDTVGVRLSLLGHESEPEARLDDNWRSRGDSSTSPRYLGLALAEAVALAHDGRVEIAEPPTGTIATLVLSRVPQRVGTPLSTAAHHSDDS
jgi:nitrogen fixation/metabolism regulation signal transduction histidine kinase